jgi:hypothetical protein
MSGGQLAVQRDLAELFRDAPAQAAAAGALALDPDAVPAPTLERPRLAEHGDWATNVALALAKAAKAPPRAVAEAMVAHLKTPDWVEGVEVAGPGFVNVRLAHRWFEDLVRRVLAAGSRFGEIDLGGERVNVEFISANPTGPLHIGNARLGPTGDALANLLAITGHQVGREYYLNDTGTQMELLGASVEAAYLRLLGRPAEPPADGYKGGYIAELAAQLHAEQGAGLADLDAAERQPQVTEWAYRRMLDMIKRTLARLGVEFDVWFSERTLHQSGAIDAAVAELRERGVVEDRDGAVWLRTTRFGDDKDRPLIRSNGEPTYFGKDVADYRDKRARGFDRLIFLWGADHHGYIPRLRAVARAFGDPEGTAEFVTGRRRPGAAGPSAGAGAAPADRRLRGGRGGGGGAARPAPGDALPGGAGSGVPSLLRGMPDPHRRSGAVQRPLVAVHGGAAGARQRARGARGHGAGADVGPPGGGFRRLRQSPTTRSTSKGIRFSGGPEAALRLPSRIFRLISRRSFCLIHHSSSWGLSRSAMGLPAPGRLSNSPRSIASRICRSTQVWKPIPGGLRSVMVRWCGRVLEVATRVGAAQPRLRGRGSGWRG